MQMSRGFLLSAAVVVATTAGAGSTLDRFGLAAKASEQERNTRPTILSVETATNPRNALMVDFEVTTSTPASVRVTYFDPLQPEFVLSKPTDVRTTHRFTIVRLKAETQYHYKVVAI